MSGQVPHNIVSSTTINMKSADILFGMLILFPLAIVDFQCNGTLLRFMRKAEILEFVCFPNAYLEC